MALIMNDELQESIADEMSQKARIKAALFMVRDLPTEDIERVNSVFPHLAQCAFTEILNPNTDAYGVEKEEE
jgi:hypothetical protein